MITSVFDRQQQLLDAIHWLYWRAAFDCDVTYGKGNFYGPGKDLRPETCFDLAPRFDFVKQADVRKLPLGDGSMGSIVFDPPFLAGGGQNSVMHRHYSSFKTVEELYAFYGEALVELHRVLRRGGILVVKCQDLNNGRTQGWSHCEIYAKALQAGFYALDLFVLTSKNRMRPYNMRNQFHARKAHSYFWVFKKCNRSNYQ